MYIHLKSKIELDDIFEVMVRVSRNQSTFAKYNEDSDSEKDDSDSEKGDSDSKKGDSDSENEEQNENGGNKAGAISKLKELLDKISPNCTSKEKHFFDYIVNTGILPI
jgi:hypothetical protein